MFIYRKLYVNLHNKTYLLVRDWLYGIGWCYGATWFTHHHIIYVLFLLRMSRQSSFYGVEWGECQNLWLHL